MIPAVPALAQRFCPRCGSSASGEGPACAACLARTAAARFCAGCGTPSEAETDQCPRCIAKPAAPTRPHRHLAPVRHALTVYFLILAGLLIAAPLAPLGRTAAESEIFAHFTNAGIVAAIAFIASLLNIRELKSVLARTGRWTWYAAAPFISFATFALATGLLYGVRRLLAIESEPYSSEYIQAGYAWWLPFIITAVCPAIFEELAFRGVITGRLRRTLEGRETLIVTAILFATLHLSPLAFAHLLVIGLVLGIVRERTGSLYPCILIHFCHNGYVVFAELLNGGLP